MTRLLSRLPTALFWLLTLGYVILPWITYFFPSQDGPTHAYNGQVVLDALFGQAEGGFSKGFSVSWMPVGNWLSAAFLGGLEVLMPGRIAEKILLSCYGLFFPLAGRYWIRSFRPDDTWRCLLVFPFAYHRLFLMGFFNFSFSVGLMLIALGYWWRNRNELSWSRAGVLNALLILTYFSHVMGTLLAFLALGIMGLVTLRERGWAGSIRHGLLLIPCGILPALFVIMLRSRSEVAEAWLFADLLAYAGRFGVLLVHHPAHAVMGGLLGGIFAMGILGFFRFPERRIHHAPILVAGFLAACFFFLPSFIFNGAFIKERLSIIWPLFLLPALVLPFRRNTSLLLAGAFAGLFAFANLLYLGAWNHHFDAAMREIDVAAERVPAGSCAVPLIFEQYGGSADIQILRYAASYRWGENGVVDWFNFQAWKDYFPTHFHAGLSDDEIYQIVQFDGDVEAFDPTVVLERTDAFLTWKMPESCVVRDRLLALCTPHPENVEGRAEVFLRN